MKRYLTKLLLTSAAVFSLYGQSFAQPLQTFETVSAFTSSITTSSSGRAFIQTFTDASFIQSLTYRFSTLAPGSFAGTSFNAYFTQWDPVNGRATGSAFNIGSQSTIQVGDVGNTAQTGFTSFTDANSNPYRGLDFQFNLNATLQSDLTYAMILVGLGSSSIGLQNIDTTDAFTFGDSFKRNSGVSTNLVTGFTNLSSGTSGSTGGFDWGFSAIAITIVPEPSTAAAVIVAGFLGVMVIRRRLQQRLKVQPVTVA